jgi:hypothetical protein
MTQDEREKQQEQLNAFDEVMAVIDLELMMRLRKRFQKRDNRVMAGMMTSRIMAREAEEKAEHEAEKKRHEEERKKHKKNK